MGAGDVARLLRVEPFASIDQSRFPRHLALEGILRNDTRVLNLAAGEIIVREGDYGNSAFLILKGGAKVFQRSLPTEMLGRGTQGKKSILKTIARAFRNSRTPEVRVHHTQRSFKTSEKTGVLIQDFPRVIREHASEAIQCGELFGEIAALGRTPRVATIVASEDDTEVLELRWQGLRDIMNFAPAFNAYIESRFRKYGLISLLRALDIMDRLPPQAAEEVATHTVFERYGRFDWYGSYQQMLKSRSATERLGKEPLILQEGDYLNGLIIVRGGFVRVSRHYNHGEQTISYLGKGQYFGLREIYHNHLHPDRPAPAQLSLRGVGYVDILVIPTNLVEEHIIPHLTQTEIRDLTAHPLSTIAGSELLSSAPVSAESEATDARKILGANMIEFFMDRRVINGGATMLIDLDRCTRCDDCVRACASTHDGNPRFIRQGPNQQGIQVTQACMHCHDPICMIPCPTGAIHRREGGEVVINDDTCIGCANCAENCPYHNIQMVEIRSESGEIQFPVSLDAEGNIVFGKDKKMIPRTDQGPVRRATKCDLCYEHVGGPACARACPHDALLRVDMQDTRKVAEWLSR